MVHTFSIVISYREESVAVERAIYYNGTILTMEEPLYADALLVENGRICAVGAEAAVRRSAQERDTGNGHCEEVDLRGHTLMPAFIDSHGHFMGYANSLLQAPMEEASSFSDIVEGIKHFIQNRGCAPGEWVFAKGYDHNNLIEKRPPDREVLDRAAPQNPLVLQHQSGHTGVLNTLALELLGITPQTPSPEGGKIEVVDGRLTGYLEENAFIQYQQKIPMSTVEQLARAVDEAQDRYASYGITTAQEGMMIDGMIALYRHLCEKELLRLDIVGYADRKDSTQLFKTFADHIGRYINRFKLGGYKIFLDGSPQARTAWMRTPYQNAKDGYHGYPTLTDEAVQEGITYAMAHNMQLLAHCNGDAASAQYLTALQSVAYSPAEIAKRRPVLIHGQLLGIDQLPGVEKYGVIPSFFVAHVYHWGDVHIQNFGEKRAGQISPTASALQAGVRFTLHQDAPVIQPNMLETVWCAVNRRTKSGAVLGAEERISAYEALKAVTKNAAYQYFEEDSKGSLKPGKRADLVILEENPLQVDPMQIREISVIETIKDGRSIFKKQSERVAENSISMRRD